MAATDQQLSHHIDFISKDCFNQTVPFYAETVRYFDSLRAAGVPAELDIYHTNMHAFDMMRPRDAQSVAAAEAFERQFADARARYFAPQENTV